MKNIKIYLAILISLTLFGCKERIDISLKDTYVRLVVDGLLTDEAKRHMIKLTKTSGYFENEPQSMATGAAVTISDGTSEVQLSETSPGIYQTDSTYNGVIGKTYTLNIKYDNEEYSASSPLKYVSPIDSVSFEKDPFMPDITTINLWAQEPATTGDYYLWLYYVNGVLRSDTLNKISFTDDLMVNGNYITGYPIYYFAPEANDTVTLEMRSITKEYNDFIYAVYMETYGAGTPFSGPPSNAKGNIKNLTHKEKDVMGFFIASAVTRKSKVFK